MTKDFLRNATIAHALVILLTKPGNDIGDPQVRVGFEAMINALGSDIEKESQIEGDEQIALLQAMREEIADMFDAGDDVAKSEARDRLADTFTAFASTIPGFHS